MTALCSLSLLSQSCRGGARNLRDALSAPRHSEAGEEVLAIVGSEVITDSELRARILQRFYTRRALLGLIRESLFRQEAERLQIEVAAEELEREVQREVARLAGDKPEERQQYLAELERNGLTLEDVKNDLRAELANVLLVRKVVQGLRLVREADIQRLYQDTYQSTRVRVRHVALPFGTTSTPPAAKVEEVRQRALEIARGLRGGDDFARTARSRSDNAETGSRGGLIGLVNEEQLGDPRLSEVVFGLKAGEISDPVRESDYGFHIFRVDERVESRPLDEVREELRGKLMASPPTSEEIAAVEAGMRANFSVTILMQDPDER